jgi:predicted GNAT superfamily acetyltransferase
MDEGDLDIRTLETAGDMATIGTVFQQVWGTVTPIVTVELLMAISHAGGYVAGAFESGNAVGASFGFLADHRGERALHSHVTGILPGVQHGGVGRAMKTHQRAWAADRGIGWIVWTFDPLVRRNAWFNIEVVGAHVTEYLQNFYGSMSDSINAHDESDRLVVAWPTSDDIARPPVDPAAETTHVATPDDIVVLRRTDPGAAGDWRFRLRDELAPLLAAGGVVTGFTRDGVYVVEHPAR